ncbi:MAG TPA: fibronectin type III domain-containing protein, partial [Cyclobacteriaceae bacterium]
MKQLVKIICFIFLTLLCTGAFSQNFPVRVTPILTPPYTPFLTDYTDLGSDKLTLQIILNDLTVNNYHCKLRLTIEGVNISITTSPDFVPPPLLLQGGVPEILYGSDLAEYFNPNNLIYKGISQNEIEKNGNKLPEGIYRFSFEVVDYNRNVVVSNKGTASAWMLLNDPPFINLPFNDAKVKPLDPQNIVFQWTPRHRGSPNSAFSTEYEVKLFEIWPKGRNPYDAVNTSQPIYELTTDATMAVYGPAETPLVLGREYALQVQAKDTGGKDLFKNNGYSEVVRFIYGDECPMPTELTADEITNIKARMRWQANGLNTGYVIRYREQSSRSEWFEENTNQSFFNLSGLRPATTYEYQLAGQCLSYNSAFTDQKTLTTLITNPNAFICGDPRVLPLPDGSPPLPVLMMNDSINAGGFTIYVTKATGKNGKFNGEGLAVIPWFNYAKVRITFENITVNKSHQLTGGAINSVWDKDSKLLKVTEQLVKKDTVSTQFKADISTFEADSTVLVKGMIVSVTTDAAGTISVTTNDGESITLEKGKSYAIADEVGNGYLVDKEGNIKKVTAQEALEAGAKGEREYSKDPNRSVLFTRADQTKYGLDAQRNGTLAQNYQQTENGKYIAWKALATGQNDFIRIVGEDKTDLSKV